MNVADEVYKQIGINLLSQCWVPPVPNQLRLDIDAGFDEGRNQFSVGAVIRDNNGTVLGASAHIIRHPGSVKDAELCAIRFGMEFCLNLGLHDVNIFSDSLLAVQAISNSLVDLGPSGVLSIDILIMLKMDAFLSINHMPRSANRAAHRLARVASEVSSFVVWCSGDIPDWLLNIVNHDIMK
ncbi:uncharacterized protein [Primulina eburnea]|uniref:uncharacterized protein n=1 Tax=Primulina eburnea TaxID=1245227 RepID=UPI003C6C7335